MYKIKKLRADHVLDFAAEELIKYLRMMMPDCGEIEILFDPAAQIDAEESGVSGFCLGLLSDFDLPSEAVDPVLDDVIHIDTDLSDGILAGSNPRSVLFAVYRFLRENGCRWLYPGVDGEHIPLQNIRPVQYHKLADHRFRGHCNEGAESQQCMLDTIDFYAKLELNTYMLEFDIPYFYYNSYYSHNYNTENRPPEPVTSQQVLQWKRQCEAEISKRGLQFHDMGHGWTAEPFGLDSSEGWVEKEVDLTEEQRECLAQLNGVRQLRGGVALNTNLCMSNPKVRTIMVNGIADYAETHRNVDYLHVWLADGTRNHCECPECQTARPSDFYLMIMNQLDEVLTEKGLSTRIVFIVYYDTLFAPETIRIQNPQRFSLLYAPLGRSYTSSITEDSVIPPPQPYLRNTWTRPCSAEENVSYLREWQKFWHGPSFCYEYHFWMTQYRDPGSLYLSRRIYEDIRSLKVMGLDGFVEDGSQRSFFPNGFPIYIFAETLMNRDCDFNAVLEDYYSHIYGEAWQEVRDYLQKLSDLFDFAYLSGEKSADPVISPLYSPDKAKDYAEISALAAQGRALAEKYRVMPTRPQTVSMRLLLRHAEYCTRIAEFMIPRAQGEHDTAKERMREFFRDFGAYEFELERYFDHALACQTWEIAVTRPGKGDF